MKSVWQAWWGAKIQGLQQALVRIHTLSIRKGAMALRGVLLLLAIAPIVAVSLLGAYLGMTALIIGIWPEGWRWILLISGALLLILSTLLGIGILGAFLFVSRESFLRQQLHADELERKIRGQ